MACAQYCKINNCEFIQVADNGEVNIGLNPI